MSNKRSNLAIWKIDRKHHLLAELSDVDDVIEKIISSFNLREEVKDEDDGDLELKLIPLDENSIDGKKIKIFHKKRKSSGWKSFIGDLVNNEYANNANIFFNINNDFLCFVYDDDDLFLITAGAGYHTIQNFVDESFPLDVAKKIFSGDFNHAEIRDLTGITYAKSENFRRSYTFSHQESFGKIWKKLSGKIDKVVIENSPELSSIIESKKKNNAEMKSSFSFRKAVTFKEVVRLINAIQSLPELSEDRKKRFNFLDTLKDVKEKKDKEKLNNRLLKSFFDILVSGDFRDAENYDFCHPSEVFYFFSGCNYKIGNKELELSDYPSAEEVLENIKRNNLVDFSDFDKFKEGFGKLSFSFKKDEEDKVPISTDVFKYFHGELNDDNKSYFFIDGKWYEPQGMFLDYLSEDFITEVFDGGLLSGDIPFLQWEKNINDKYNESDFNKRQAQENNFYFGDKIFAKTGKGEIELFDLLYFTDDKLYIIQVKGGFGASVRDACSQIQMAADIIENDLKKDALVLKEYFDNWIRKNGKDLTERDFLELFSKERIYVFACSTPKKFTKKNFESKKLKSNIAQFEVLGIKNFFKGRGYKFNIHHIERL